MGRSFGCTAYSRGRTWMRVWAATTIIWVLFFTDVEADTLRLTTTCHPLGGRMAPHGPLISLGVDRNMRPDVWVDGATACKRDVAPLSTENSAVFLFVAHAERDSHYTCHLFVNDILYCTFSVVWEGQGAANIQWTLKDSHCGLDIEDLQQLIKPTTIKEGEGEEGEEDETSSSGTLIIILGAVCGTVVLLLLVGTLLRRWRHPTAERVEFPGKGCELIAPTTASATPVRAAAFLDTTANRSPSPAPCLPNTCELPEEGGDTTTTHLPPLKHIPIKGVKNPDKRPRLVLPPLDVQETPRVPPPLPSVRETPRREQTSRDDMVSGTYGYDGGSRNRLPSPRTVWRSVHWGLTSPSYAARSMTCFSPSHSDGYSSDSDVIFGRSASWGVPMCKVCFENVIDGVVYPCEHSPMCSQCFEAIHERDVVVRCPMCQTTADRFSSRSITLSDRWS